jgi:chemotaxis protein CheX
MDVNVINPILSAFADILPQIGFEKVTRKKVTLVEANVDNAGVFVNIAVLGQFRGVVLIGMDLNSAKRFASKMMMGTEVTVFDALSQSAIAEMGNMVCANACMKFAGIGINGLDISPPTLMISEGGKVMLPVAKAVAVGFDVDGMNVDIYVGIVSS